MQESYQDAPKSGILSDWIRSLLAVNLSLFLSAAAPIGVLQNVKKCPPSVYTSLSPKTSWTGLWARRIGLSANQLGLRANQPGFRSSQPGLGSSQLDGWTEGCMDRHREFIPILQDFVPYWGHSPASQWKIQVNKEKQGKQIYLMPLGNFFCLSVCLCLPVYFALFSSLIQVRSFSY